MAQNLSRNLLAVHLKDVHLTLTSEAGDVNILRGINLDVVEGEAMGIVGPSGGGKSTMMMVIAGLEKASSGLVKTAGKDLNKLTEDDLALFRRDNVGIVFQDFHLFPTMTALENVAITLELGENNKTETDVFKRAEDQLKLVGLGDRLTHYPSQLSGGEQQRVAVARAFVSNPKILLADEPTGNLDGETSKVVIDLLFDLHQRVGTTMLLISHDQTLATRCDRIVTLADGKIKDLKSNVET